MTPFYQNYQKGNAGKLWKIPKLQTNKQKDKYKIFVLIKVSSGLRKLALIRNLLIQSSMLSTTKTKNPQTRKDMLDLITISLIMASKNKFVSDIFPLGFL